MTKDFVFYDSQGVIKIFQSCTPPEAEAVATYSGLSYIEHGPVDITKCVVRNGRVEGASIGDFAPSPQLSAEDMWLEVKRVRGVLLQQSDWTQLPDVPLATKEPWAEYRQALRDITDQPDPFNIVWPVVPG